MEEASSSRSQTWGTFAEATAAEKNPELQNPPKGLRMFFTERKLAWLFPLFKAQSYKNAKPLKTREKVCLQLSNERF